ncbi:hypothetical protein [Tenacibaculum amylolyticum]|uniref:hypothetical protein n=1 Tax=Tenacibaculum amylolyticum TaxID=104269 RepID=UPI003895E015
MVYKTLFNINLLHAYFLDLGEKKYHTANANDALSVTEKEEAIKQYLSSDAMEIVPNTNTLEILKNHRLLVRKHSKGITVLASSSKEIAEENNVAVERYSPLIKLSGDLILTFYIKVSDTYFEHYTDIIDRRKDQLYYLSNTTSSATNIFDANTVIKTWNSFLITEKESRELVHTLEKEEESRAATPKQVTIANIDTVEIAAIETKITNNIPLNTAEEEIINSLNGRIQLLKSRGIIGVLQVKISGVNNTNVTENVLVKNGVTGNFDIPAQCVLKTAPDFQIYLENRKTFWRYNQSSTGVKMITNTQYPLTKNGRVEIKKTDVTPQPGNTIFLPNPTVESITKEQQDYYSEIFI